ncbi:protein charybde [Teleopsis dalmanni]|uniref:protein charybde n=1 Tax=Teleopsis dalmanni TaxID=139649 RepID=UPI0018CEF779|nr:protein charybde [Teleopsis dalmanni]
MKMEVLSVQNQFQGQFGVIGSSKVKDWTSPLTPPPPPPSHNRSQQRSLVSQQQKQQNQQQQKKSQSDSAESGIDIVDGIQPQHFYHRNQYTHVHNRQQQQKQQQQQQQQQYYSQSHQQQQHHLYQQQHLNYSKMNTTTAAVAVESSTSSRFAYNNNLLCCDESVTTATDAATTATTPDTEAVSFITANDEINAAAINELSRRLQAELRAAKSRHLGCTEVTLPWDLTPRIAAEIIKTSEREPCGVRSCTIFIEFEDEPNNTRRIATFKVDPNTVSTFELYLTLKHDRSGWTSKLPQFLKNLTRSSTILISPDFTLTKNKLYSSE